FCLMKQDGFSLRQVAPKFPFGNRAEHLVREANRLEVSIRYSAGQSELLNDPLLNLWPRCLLGDQCTGYTDDGRHVSDFWLAVKDCHVPFKNVNPQMHHTMASRTNCLQVDEGMIVFCANMIDLHE